MLGRAFQWGTKMRSMTDEQKDRFVALANRKAELARGMIGLGIDDDNFRLYAAELAKMDAETDALMRDVLGPEGYREHRQNLKESLAKEGLEDYLD